MYKINLFASVLFAILLVRCIIGPDVRFPEPQPEHKRNLVDFPNKYIGTYMSLEDSSALIIDKYNIFQKWKAIIKCSNTEMNDLMDTVFTEDTEYFVDNWFVKVDIEQDSPFLYANSVDTLFRISEEGVLRSYKGHLFLNDKIEEGCWKVRLMKLKNGQLDFYELIEPSQIDSLSEVMEMDINVDSIKGEGKYFNLEIERKHIKELLKKETIKSSFVKLD